jgi:probable HAF family extracellular repeat protein
MSQNSGARTCRRVLRASQVVLVLMFVVLLAARAATAFVIEDLGTLGGISSGARAMNDGGQVVGFSATAGGATHAFSWTPPGPLIDLGHLGGDFSEASAVNDGGQVVGTSITAGGARHAFSWTPAGGMVDLGTLGGTSSRAVAVNASGQVVGLSTPAGDAEHAVLWSPPPTSKDQCKNNSWKTFTNPTFKNEGDCIQFVITGK